MNLQVAPRAQPASAAERQLHLSAGKADVYRYAGEIDPHYWATAFANTPKGVKYYELLERTMRSHFDYRYLVICDDRGHALALQPLVLATQDLAAVAGERFRRLVTNLRVPFARFFQSRIVLAGCLVGEGKTGFIQSDQEMMPLVAEAVEEFARSENVGLIAFKDFPAASRKAFSPLQSAGYVRLAGFPSLALDLDFASFDDYMMTRLSKVTRKSLRRKLSVAESALPPITLEVLTSIEKEIDDIYPLYLAVAQRSNVRFEVFTPDYFVEASRLSPGTFRYFIWRQGGRAVAFSFCTVWNDTIYDNDIGFDYDVAYDLNLYYLTFRDVLKWALKEGLRRYASAPFSYDPKLHLRLEPQPIDL
jgi:Uncharacterized protein conserved in bacteria